MIEDFTQQWECAISKVGQPLPTQLFDVSVLPRLVSLFVWINCEVLLRLRARGLGC
jgi:hypothetical protein